MFNIFFRAATAKLTVICRLPKRRVNHMTLTSSFYIGVITISPASVKTLNDETYLPVAGKMLARTGTVVLHRSTVPGTGTRYTEKCALTSYHRIPSLLKTYKQQPTNSQPQVFLVCSHGVKCLHLY